MGWEWDFEGQGIRVGRAAFLGRGNQRCTGASLRDRGGQGGWSLAGKTRHEGTTGWVPRPSQPGKELGVCSEVGGKASVGFRFYV